MVKIAGSTFLNFNSWSYTNETDPARAFGYNHSGRPAQNSDGRLVIGLVLERNHDPSELLSMNWGDRQKALAELNASGTLWSTYGADENQYNLVKAQLIRDHITILDSNGYISSAASRTIWIEVSADHFKHVFGTELLAVTSNERGTLLYWNGELSVPDEWNVPGTSRSSINGLWLDNGQLPIIQNVLEGAPVTLPQYAQSPGNSFTSANALHPQDIAALYNFPLKNPSIVTGTIGVMEPTIGDKIPHDSIYPTFQEGFEAYRSAIHIDNNATPFRYYLGDNGGVRWSYYGGERNLDVGILTSINPNSNIGLYVGTRFIDRTVYPAFQTAIWDLENNPGILSSSYSDYVSPAPGSPWLRAYHELYLDAALRNMTVFQASDDGGSSNGIPNGRTNVIQVETSEYMVLVGGTSLSIPSVASQDLTLSDIVAKAAAGDMATLRLLVATGLTDLPQNASAFSSYIETAWNQIVLNGNEFYGGESYFDATSGNGGVDLTTPIPRYQLDYGLRPIDAATGGTGRGEPDVSAGAGGNITYRTPNTDFSISGGPGGYGTSAAAPLWAALGLQIQTIFEDQGLPRPGYMHDLLYTAAVVAPASFNDISLGNNVTSMNSGGPLFSHDVSIFSFPGNAHMLTPTGLGYQAGPGYDLVTGLGSPNGLLLARALTSIAHSQMWSDSPELLNRDIGGKWTAGAQQTVLLQPTYAHDGRSTVTIGDAHHVVSSEATSPYAWSDQLAQQSLQANFSSDLVIKFDKQSQGIVGQARMDEAQVLGVAVGHDKTTAPQASLSNAFGFVDFEAGVDSLRIARPVAVAETALGENDTMAVLRLRQNGGDDLSISLYRVDDLSGTIDGVAPGSLRYSLLAEARSYHTSTGEASIDGPGYGEYAQQLISDVDAGDFIAFKLTNHTRGDVYWGFSEANEVVDGAQVGHLWNYGLNTWGFEDTWGGGDRDFNDLVFQLDFTSTAGEGWLV